MNPAKLLLAVFLLVLCAPAVLYVARRIVSWLHRLTWRDRHPVPLQVAERELAQALARMTRKRGRPYVLLEDKRSERFVQFCGSRSEPLLLDLPLGQFGSPIGDVAKIKAILGEFTLVTEVFPALQRRCVSAEEAASLAVRIVREVYGVAEDETVLLTEAA